MYDFDFSSVGKSIPVLADGMKRTALITGVAILVGMVWGTILAVARILGGRVISTIAAAYVNVFRSVPLVMVILWFYLLVPGLLRKFFGYHVGDARLASALTAFSLFEAAYYSEIFRAGIGSVSRGQLQASLALGLSKLQAMRLIILPQAIRRMAPLLLTQAIILFQDSSLVYVIGLSDFFGIARQIGDRDGRLVELVIFAGGVYFVICFIASQLVRSLQRRVST